MSTTEQRTESPRSGTRRLGDSVFAGTAFGAAFLILVALAGVAIFLVVQGAPALGAGAGGAATAVAPSSETGAIPAGAAGGVGK